MQLREVGKLAMYLWKMWWLQRSRHGALLWVVASVECQLASVVAPVIVLVSASAGLLCGGGPLSPRAGARPSLCLMSDSCGTVAVQGNLTV